MRNRLCLQNLPKYSDRLKLDKDLLVLQRALRYELPNWDPEESDWQLPIIIEQFHHAKVAPYLPVKRYFVDGPFVQHQAGLSQSGASRFGLQLKEFFSTLLLWRETVCYALTSSDT